MAGLYLHVPFQQSPRSSQESAFTTALTREIEQYAQHPLTDRDLRMLYVGGGHPSRLSASTLQTLVEALREHLGATTLQEATLELHSTDASPSFLAALRELGVTRLSIGSPSLVDEKLRPTIRQAREAGFESLSVDLVFGDADPSHGAWKRSLQRTVDLRVPHVTLHERTSDGNGESSEDERADRFAFAMTFLQAKGYEQYELTHFARPGHHSRYQEHVYAHGNVLGLGPGAESFWWPDRTDPSSAQRWSNVTDIAAYVVRLRNDESPVAQQKTLDRTALAREYILLRLRTSAGLDLDVLNDRYGFPLRNRRASTLDRLAEEGLIHDDPDRVRLTDRGRLLTDAITQRLIREA